MDSRDYEDAYQRDDKPREVKSNRAWRLECESLRQQLAECERERDELVVALSKYGHHIEGCGHGWSCSCGFYEALAKAERREAAQLGAEKEET